MIPWWWRWAALGGLIAACCVYTGLKVASHYQDKLDKIEQVAVIQKEKVRVIEVKQREVVKNANQTVKTAVALSDEFYRSLLPRPGEMPDITGTPGGTDETPTERKTNPTCNPSDAAADAITVLAWQKFYMDLRKANTGD